MSKKNEIKRYGKGMISKLDESGDSRIEWDPEVEEEVKVAEDMFKTSMKIPGMKAYEVSKDGTKNISRPLKRFNPNAEKIILVPQIAGG
jgi:hypothetical protein